MTDRSDQETGNGIDVPQQRVFTVPNVISLIRLVGAAALVPIALTGRSQLFVLCFVALHVSDWIDGKLARWLHQRSDFGARLDSVSDAILSTCLLIGCIILKGDVIRQEILWLIIAMISYALNCGYALWKYGRIASYHSFGAKLSQWLVLVGAVFLLMDWSLWPIRIAAISGTLTNLEATAITHVLPEWHADVLTLRTALRIRKSTSAEPG